MKFPQMKQKEVEELHLLIDYSVSLVSLINLNALSEGLNRNANILELEADLFTAFAGSSQCSNFKKFANILKDERSENLEEIKSKITMLKEKPLISANPFILNMLKVNYKATNFKDIKIAYRFVLFSPLRSSSMPTTGFLNSTTSTKTMSRQMPWPASPCT